MIELDEKYWLRVLALIYIVTLFFLVVTTLVTFWALSHPEIGFQEVTQLVRDYVSKYGLAVGLIVVLAGNVVFIFLWWPLFLFKKIRKLRTRIVDSIVYSCLSAWGLSAFILWLLNAANDIHVVIFRSTSHFIRDMLRLWDSLFLYLALIKFLVLFLILCYLTRISKFTQNR